MLLTLGALVRWRRRHARLEAQSRAERAALECKADAEQESLLQSGQGMLLRFEAIARRLPTAHPIRKELAEALDRAEQWLEKGLDRAQHRRDNKEESGKPDAPD
jgi:predicted RNase H-like HicB family nuclease